MGLTTRKTKGENSTRKNYKCEVNPLGGSGESYLRRQGMVARKQEYDKQEKKRGAMPPKDYEVAKGYADKAKERYIREQNAKKSNDVPTLRSYSRDFKRNRGHY